MRLESRVVGPAFVALAFALVGGAAAQTPPTFGFSGFSSGGLGTTSVAPRDLDHDGQLDLATANVTSGDVSVLLGDGTGSFLPPSVHHGTWLSRVVVAFDVTGDAHPDLVALDNSGTHLELFAGDGSGGFTSMGSIPTGGFSLQTRILQAGDFDLDGKLDVAVLFETVNLGLRVLLNTGTGFGSPIPTALPNTQVLSDMDAGDFDEDGAADLVVARSVVPAGPTIQLLLSNGDGTFVEGGSAVAAGTEVPRAVAAGDLDEDGHLDAALTVAALPGAYVARGLGDGTLAAVVPPFPGVPLVADSNGLAIEDVNADGHRDLVVAYGGGGVTVSLGDGALGFAAAALLPVAPFGFSPGIAVADLTGDGRNDLVVAMPGGHAVAVYTNQTPYAAGLSPYGVGTHGCDGVHGINANGPARIGTPGFRFLFSNAPPSALGALFIADGSAPGGIDYGLDVTFLVDLAGSSFVLAVDAYSDMHGFAFAPVPIPDAPSIVSATLYAQGVFVTLGPCLPTPFGASTSTALAFTIQP